MEHSQDGLSHAAGGAKARWVIDKVVVENFKSYKGTHVIGPFTDFSCIIGPNGSGKSNAMDAISFVLGVDKKEMRAKSTISLVYDVQGQEAPAKASVEMYFKKKDTKALHEVVFKATVSRKNGEVRYFVDGQHLGKKAYHEAMAKYNIHVTADWTNFLVFQGQVEQIAMKDPKQITEMIEQVSGSKALKAEYEEKKIAWQKAEEAVADASKVKRTAGVERGQLKQHQKEAEKYHAVQADLKELRTTEGLGHFFFIESTIDRNKKILVEANASVQTEQEKTKKIESQLKEKKGVIADLHKEVLGLMKSNRDKEHELHKKRRAADEIKASTDQLRVKISRTNDALDQARATGKENLERVRSLERELGMQKGILAAHEKEWEAEDQKGGELSKQDHKEYLVLRDRAKQETLIKGDHLKAAKRELAQAQEHHSSVLRSTRDVDTRIRHYEDSVRDCDKRMAALQGNSEQQSQELAQAKSDHKSVSDRIVLLKQQSGQQEQELRALAAQLTGIRADREESRKEEKTRHALEELKKIHSGVRGRLCDLVKIPDNKYKIAAAVAMGKNLDAIVTDNEKTAHACVRYLRDHRLVTMNFIPLDSVRGKDVSDALRMIFTGSVKALADCLEHDAEVAPAIRYAIGECLVCDTMKEAQHFAWEHSNGRNKVVMTDGTVLMKNGVMQGGSQSGAKRSQRFDEKHYLTLKERRDKLVYEQRDAHDELTRLEVRERELSAQVSQESGRRETQQVDLKEWERKKKVAQEQLAEQRKLEKESKPRLHQADAAIKAAEVKTANLEKDVNAVEHKVLGAFGKRVGITNFHEYDRRTLLREKERAEKRAQVNQLVSRLENQIEFERKKNEDDDPEQLAKVMERLQKEIKANQADEKARMAEFDKVESAVKDVAKTLEGKQKAMKAAEDQSKELKRHHDDANEELTEAKKHRHQLNNILDMLRQQRSQLYDKCRLDEIEIPLTKAAKQGQGKKGDADDDGQGADGYVTLSEAFVSDSQLTQSQLKLGKDDAKTTTSDVGKLGKEGLITIDFGALPAHWRNAVSKGEAAYKELKKTIHREIERAQEDLDKLNPNLKAGEKLVNIDSKLRKAEEDVTCAGEQRRLAQLEFRKIEEKRTQKYHDAFNVISAAIDPIYKVLTGSLRDGQATGQAFLQQMNQEEPYQHGTAYDVMPPKKRSRSMHELSGGEKTLAALALLFAIHKASPAPFYVLDEVDAALDRYNTEQVIAFVEQSKKTMQFLVTTHKDQFYSSAETLCGVHKVQQDHSSGMKTLDLRPFPDDAADDEPPPPKSVSKSATKRGASASGRGPSSKRTKTPGSAATTGVDDV